MAWDYLLDAAAPLMDFGAKSNTSELRVDYPNGSQVRLFGADNYEALRGLRFDGVVLDEYANFDPRAWPEVISPTLADRGGFAVFIGTPKGHNQFYKVWTEAQGHPDWYTLMLKASDTVPLNAHLSEKEAQKKGLLTPKELEREKQNKTEDQYAQEYETSFEAAVMGAYYGKQIQAAHNEKRITSVPYDAAATVWTAWDLGIRDSTAIWFAQLVGKEIHLIDFYESIGQPLDHYVKIINDKQYAYAGHAVPHDAQARELGTGLTRFEVLESLGLRNLTVAPRQRVEDGINAARVLFPRCWFDAKKCADGIEALTLYRSNYNEKLEALTTQPVHDWTSHAADAFRTLAQAIDQMKPKPGFSGPINYPNLGLT